MEKKYLKNIVAFCVLMENGEGILGKSPEYILEKFERYALTIDEDAYNWGLDLTNKRKLATWLEKWKESER